jgi:uncharacterized protein (DUF58 family)
VLAGPAAAAGLVSARRPLIAGALALVVLVALDAASARRAMPRPPVGLRPLADGTAGGTVAYGITSAPARRGLTVARVGPGGDGPAAGVLVPPGVPGEPIVATADLPAPPRGVFARETFTVATRGPLGLASCTRRQSVDHAPALAVGPAPVPHDVRWPGAATAAATGEARAPRGDDLHRGARPYERGDARRSVHWPATARRGTLMVRETDGTGTRTVRIVIGFARPGPEAERALGRAAWLAAEGHRAGWQVWLVTCEGPALTVARPLAGRGDLVRRLAAAVEGRPVVRPAPVATRWITPDGDTWR